MLYKILTEGRVELLENLLENLIRCGLLGGICYVANIIGKYLVARLIIKNHDISDDKVKAVTKMMSKDININLH